MAAGVGRLEGGGIELKGKGLVDKDSNGVIVVGEGGIMGLNDNGKQ